jgi:hypothetical protein
MDLTHKIVRRLLRDQEVGFSRNQNFEAYEDPRVKRAVRIFRHLRSVEDDLLALVPDGAVELDALERDKERIIIRLVFADAGGRRASFLSASEWELLLENDRVTNILRGLLDRATTETRETIESMMPVDRPD